MRQKKELGSLALLSCLIVVVIGVFLCGVSAWAGDEDVIFYEHTNFGGKQLKSSGLDSIGDLTRNQLVTAEGSSVNWNDKISSISIGKNRKVVMYEHSNFKGASILLNGPTICKNVSSGLRSSMPGGWNDRVSSFKILVNDLPDPNPASANQYKVYQDINYCGTSFSPVISSSEINYNIDSLDSSWNDKISSIRLGSNLILTVFEHSNYGGASFSEFGPSDMPNLVTSGWNDKISSFKVRKR